MTSITDTRANLTRGYLICLAATAFLSTTAIFIGYLNTNYGLPPVVLAFWRDFMVAGALAAAFAIFWPLRLRVARQHITFLVLYGLLLSIFNSLWAASVAFNGAAVATVLAYSSPGFTAILGWRLFGERLGSWKVLAVETSSVFVSRRSVKGTSTVPVFSFPAVMKNHPFASDQASPLSDQFPPSPTGERVVPATGSSFVVRKTT